MIYIFDIDGTLSNLEHRLHHIQKLDGSKPDWTGFFADCDKDEPIPEVIAVAKALVLSSHLVILLTGRSDEISDKTWAWIKEYDIPSRHMYMRKQGDHREDSIVKAELLDELLEDWKDTIAHQGIGGIFEDRQQVVDMYRSRGLRVFQVAPGDF